MDSTQFIPPRIQSARLRAFHLRPKPHSQPIRPRLGRLKRSDGQAVPDAYIYSQNMKAAGGAESGSKRHDEKSSYPASNATFRHIATPT
jgi:hypothetical protein